MGGEGEKKKEEEEGRGRKGREGETRHTNPSLLPAPLCTAAIGWRCCITFRWLLMAELCDIGYVGTFYWLGLGYRLTVVCVLSKNDFFPTAINAT